MIALTPNGGLTVIIQVTNRCQLDCPYCMATKNDDDTPRVLVEKVIRFIDDKIPISRPVTIVWHGGEPLMMGVGFYRWVDELQHSLTRDRGRIRNVFQTNGLLLTDEYLNFLEQVRDFTPNISMDGPSVVTEQTRGVKAGAYDRLFKRLQSREIPFGVAVVATEQVLKNKKEVIKYFEERNILNVGIVPYHAFKRSDEEKVPTATFSINGSRLVKEHVTVHAPLPPPSILAELALEWPEATSPGLKDVTLLGRALVRGIVSKNFQGDCLFSSFADGCHRYVLCIAVNGEIYPCPRGQNVGLWHYGNVDNGGLENWWGSTFGPAPFRPELPTECSPCRHKSACNGGCPANALSMNGGRDKRDYYCESFIRLFDAAASIIDQEMSATSPA